MKRNNSNGTRQLACSFTCRYIMYICVQINLTIRCVWYTPGETQIGETNIFCLLQLQHYYLKFNEIRMHVRRVECTSHHHAAVFNLCCMHAW